MRYQHNYSSGNKVVQKEEEEHSSSSNFFENKGEVKLGQGHIKDVENK